MTNQQHPILPEIELIDECRQNYVDGWKDALNVILDIADDLDGVKYGTYRCDLSSKNND